MNVRSSKSRSLRLTAKLNGRKIWKRFLSNQELRTNPQCSSSLIVKSKNSHLWRTSTTSWIHLKFRTCSLLMKRLNSWKKWDQLLRIKINWKKEHQPNCTASSWTSVRRICTLCSHSVQLVNLSELGSECSLHLLIAVPLIGSKIGLKMLCSGWLENS